MGMTDQERREKVIKALEICAAGEWNKPNDRDCTSCPYYPAGYTGCTGKLLVRDVLVLLKAQDQHNGITGQPDKKDIAACPIHDTSPRYGMGYEYYDWLCPNCKAFLAPEPAVDEIPRRCQCCGQLLKEPDTDE